MLDSWTFGKKLGAAFGATALAGILLAAAAISVLRSTVEREQRASAPAVQRMAQVMAARDAFDRKWGETRVYWLTGDNKALERARAAQAELLSALGSLRQASGEETSDSLAERHELIRRIEASYADLEALHDKLNGQRAAGSPNLNAAIMAADHDLIARRTGVTQAIDALVGLQTKAVEETQRASAQRISHEAIVSLILASVLVSLLAFAFASALSRMLARRVGSAIHNVQSSSTELQASSNQQVTSAQELASATSEISTTLKELLATSREIAGSAQRVVGIAEETAATAQSGDRTVQGAQNAIAAIKRQVDVIVTHMLELGKKSQQVGSILEVINELAEQTNIVAINATIESVGAGEAGQRFAVIANEIQRLADRVAGSSRQIRALIEEIRAAANATVMATEDGSKAVDAGTRQFGDVVAIFHRIVERVGSTTEAAREIELSTKQQATAVEQVNLAIGDVAQAAKETESNSAQTLETSSMLSGISRELAQVVRSEAST